MGSYSGQGDFFISIYPPKQIKSKGGFTSGGYAGGAVQIFLNDCFVGDPGGNNIEVWSLPAHKKFALFNDESSGDYLTFGVASNYLYSVSYGTKTLQIYDFRSGRLLNFLSGFGRGVAVDPSGRAA
jgi:hypothetical protein